MIYTQTAQAVRFSIHMHDILFVLCVFTYLNDKRMR
jgi:hypothetical protein